MRAWLEKLFRQLTSVNLEERHELKLLILTGSLALFSYISFNLVSNKISVRIINDTRKMLENVEIELCDKTLNIGNVEPGKTINDYVFHSCESSLIFTIANPYYQSKGSCCYVTTGVDMTYVFKVKKDDVQIYSEI